MCPIPQALQRCCFALLLALCLASSLYARQVPPSESQALPMRDDDSIHFEHLTTSDGLTSNFITTVLQDHRGYLWVGTFGGGLLRYDGYEGKAYRHVEGDPASLSNDLVWAIHVADAGTQTTLMPSKDNTLYESNIGMLSNGSGTRFFAGRTNQGQNSVRRGLVAFDVAGALPAGVVVESVELTMNMTQTRGGAETIALHRVEADWGEGASVAGRGQGGGAQAATDDATWIHTFFDTSTWTTPGGDFAAVPSASAEVDGLGTYTWGSTPEIVADVQAWLDDPAGNFGWLIKGNESAGQTSKAFDSREGGNPPVLTIGFPLLPVDYEFNSPPLAQIGETYEANISIPGIDPQPFDPYFNMEFFIGIETNDPIEIEIPGQFPFVFVPIDPDTPADELERLGGKFGEDPINRCSEGVWKCGKIEFGDGFEFETEIFVDGFESGDISSWSTGAAADNSTRKDKQQPVGVLDEDKKLPVITEEELKKAIELFNDDVVFDSLIIGLVSERFGILEPLPPARGRYFFDEFESFRKSGSQAPVTVDGSQCPSPCSGLVLAGGNSGVNGIRIEGFPDYGVEIASDGNRITRSEFAGNGAGGLLINGSNNVVGDSLETANLFGGNDVASIIVASGTGNSLLFNTFGRGIDLGGDGDTPNDDGDDDTGANNLQNHPILENVFTGGSTTVTGSLNSTPNATFRVQFFGQVDDTGAGVFLGETSVTTDDNGDARIDVVINGTVKIGGIIAATATDAEGNTSEFSDGFEVVSGVATEDEPGVPTEFALDQNYPNPFNPSTTIRYAVPQASPVRLEVFDMLGRLVAVLVDERKAAGAYELVFDASGLPSGAYFYKMTGERFSQTKTLMLLK